MSSGSVPGSSGENMIYYLLAGVAAFGGLYYAYRTVSSSRNRYIEHMNVLHERAEERKAKNYKGDEEETAEVIKAAAATEETDTVAPVESAAQDGSSGVSSETGGEGDLPAADAPAAVEGAQQEAAVNLEAAASSEAANAEAATLQETEGASLDLAASPAREENVGSAHEGAASAAPETPGAVAGDEDTAAAATAAVEEEEEEAGQAAAVSTEGTAAEDVAKES